MENKKYYELFLSENERSLFGVGKNLGKAECEEYPRKGDFVSYSDSSYKKPFFYEVLGTFRCIEGKWKLKGIEKVVHVVVKSLEEKPKI